MVRSPGRPTHHLYTVPSTTEKSELIMHWMHVQSSSLETRSVPSWDISIFRFSSWRLSAILDFWNWNFLTALYFRDTFCVIVPNFVEISHTVAEISQFFTFFCSEMWKFTRWSRLIWCNFVQVEVNWIKFRNFAYIWTYNKRVQCCSKIRSRWDNIARKPYGRRNFLTHTAVYILLIVNERLRLWMIMISLCANAVMFSPWFACLFAWFGSRINCRENCAWTFWQGAVCGICTGWRKNWVGRMQNISLGRKSTHLTFSRILVISPRQICRWNSCERILESMKSENVLAW